MVKVLFFWVNRFINPYSPFYVLCRQYPKRVFFLLHLAGVKFSFENGFYSLCVKKTKCPYMLNKITINGTLIETDADEKTMVFVERHFAKHTKRDSAIRNEAIPQKPLWLNMLVRLIRYWQNRVSHRLGNRCVFDPSCSHYAELAFRKKGFVGGLRLIIKRLHRCRPGNGGVDELQ
jgi:uncharacterized protein